MKTRKTLCLLAGGLIFYEVGTAEARDNPHPEIDVTLPQYYSSIVSVASGDSLASRDEVNLTLPSGELRVTFASSPILFTFKPL
jgi:hypothetical protein